MAEVTDLSESPSYQLWLATNAWQRLIRRALQPLDLTHVQFTVLASIKRLGINGDPVSQADVCRFGSLDANMASQVVRSLEQKGFLARLPHPTDRRAHELELTPAGVELVEKAKKLVAPASMSFFEPLGEQQRDLARMLRIINAQAKDDLSCSDSGTCP